MPALGPIAAIIIADLVGVAAGTDIAEAVVAADTVSSQGTLVGAIVEAASAVDTVSMTFIGTSAVAETASAIDTLDAAHFNLRWIISFEDVVPAPSGEGPGNPGVLFGETTLLPAPPPRNNRRTIKRAT